MIYLLVFLAGWVLGYKRAWTEIEDEPLSPSDEHVTDAIRRLDSGDYFG